MSKSNLKLIFTLFFVFLILFNSICFAEDSNNDIVLISDTSEQRSVDSQESNSDLYISENQYSIKNVIAGNVFASVKDLTIDSSYNAGIITGNLFATANNVNIKSNVKYSETEKDEFGNSKLESVINASEIDGNVFVTANKFVLDPACQIKGDLFVCANEITLSQNAVITGNVFVVANKLNLNSKIENGSLYATVKDFNMQYYGFVSRDLHISTKTANISGYVYRNSFISADKITTTSTFVNGGDFNIESASNLAFSGEIKGNANINSKNIAFNSKDDSEKGVNCKIYGNLNYSSNKEIKIDEKVILGTTNYSKYKSSNNLLASIGKYLVNLITSLLYIIAIYLFINKFGYNYINKLSNISLSKLLHSIALGLGILIILPILAILLFATNVGSSIGILLAILYVLMLILAKPIFIIWLSEFFKNKKNSNIIIYLITTTFVLSLLSLIPVIGFIISLLVNLSGLGLFIKSLHKKNKTA